MKNKLSVLLASTLLITSLSSISAFGSDFEHEKNFTKGSMIHEGKGKHFLKHRFKRIARFLNLTEEQHQKAKEIMQQTKVSRLALKENMQSFHQESKILIMAETFDEQAFLNLQRMHQDSFVQMGLIKMKSKHGFMQILTNEQKEKMKTFKSKQRHNKRRSIK